MSAYPPPITASVDVEVLGGLTFPKGNHKLLPSFAEFVHSALGMSLSSLPPVDATRQHEPPTKPTRHSVRPLREIVNPDRVNPAPIKLAKAADLAQFMSPRTSPRSTVSLKGANISEILHLYGLGLENLIGPRFALRVPIGVCTAITPAGPCNQVHSKLDPSSIHAVKGQTTCAWKDCGHKVPAELGPYAGYALLLHVVTAHYGGAPACRLCNFPLFTTRGESQSARLARHLSSGWCCGLAQVAVCKGLPVPLPEERTAPGEAAPRSTGTQLEEPGRKYPAPRDSSC